MDKKSIPQCTSSTRCDRCNAPFTLSVFTYGLCANCGNEFEKTIWQPYEHKIKELEYQHGIERAKIIKAYNEAQREFYHMEGDEE